MIGTAPNAFLHPQQGYVEVLVIQNPLMAAHDKVEAIYLSEA